MKTMRSDRLKLILSIIWFVMTFSMVSWWLIFSLRQLDSIASGIASEKYERLRMMLFWEGSFLLGFIFIGGSALLILTNRERMRNLRLRLFFSNFSHDLKTSISRLRIRTEVLAQNNRSTELQELLAEANRLDLQLENSLWVAKGEEQNLNINDLVLGDIISHLRVEWPDLEIGLQRNAKIKADATAIRSVFRNILQNAWLHGEASKIEIKVEADGANDLIIIFSDNGKGFEGNLQELGRDAFPATERQGNGLGLYLTRLLLEKMNGKLSFKKSNQGFQVELKMKGSVL